MRDGCKYQPRESLGECEKKEKERRRRKKNSNSGILLPCSLMSTQPRSSKILPIRGQILNFHNIKTTKLEIFNILRERGKVVAENVFFEDVELRGEGNEEK